MNVGKKSEIPRVSQKPSVRPEVVSVKSGHIISPRATSPHMMMTEKKDSAFFSERTLTFLGIIASIIALSLALWSIHRGTDLSKRVSDLNLAVVDLVVDSKKTPVVEQSHNRTSKTIRDKLDEKRAKRVQRSSKLDNVFEAEMDRTAQLKADHDHYIATVSKEYRETQMKMDVENKIMMEKTRQQIEEMKRRREMEAEARKHTNAIDKIEQPNPMEIMGKPLGKVMDMAHKIGEKFTESQGYAQEAIRKRSGLTQAPTIPILETRVEDDVDLEDLEKDLKLLVNRR